MRLLAAKSRAELRVWHRKFMAPQTWQTGDRWGESLPVHLQTVGAKFHGKASRGSHIKRQHIVVGVTTQGRYYGYLSFLNSIQAVTHLIDLSDL